MAYYKENLQTYILMHIAGIMWETLWKDDDVDPADTVLEVAERVMTRLDNGEDETPEIVEEEIERMFNEIKESK